MKIIVQKSFERDIAKITNKELASLVLGVIEELENCHSLSKISHLKKMAGKGGYYRIRVGDYRLGLKLSQDTLVLLRFMSRKDIYKYFP
jgi:mRNA interferase RelE/StbE